MSGLAGWVSEPSGGSTTRPRKRSCSYYPKDVKVADADMETLYLQRDAYHGEWKYTFLPRLMQIHR